MAIKKINGYKINMEQVLGRGSYGTVHPSSLRSIRPSTNSPAPHALSKSSAKVTVKSASFSENRPLHEGYPHFRNQTLEGPQIPQYRRLPRRHGKRQQLLPSPGALRRRPRQNAILQAQKSTPIAGSNINFVPDL